MLTVPSSGGEHPRRRAPAHGAKQNLSAPRRVAVLLLLAAGSLAGAAGCTRDTDHVEGICTQVLDGDSIMVTVGARELNVRLEGIDAPEYYQAFGDEAAKLVERRAARSLVTLDVRGLDKYGRTLARVSVRGVDLSLELVREGLAWHYVQYSDDPKLASAEKDARGAGSKIWSQSDPQPPWEARRRRKAQSHAATSTAHDSAEYHGNTRSRVFHKRTCRNHGCKNCTVGFNTREDALQAGYRPAGDCRP